MGSMANSDVQAAKRYHDGTKHSYASVTGSQHALDWTNQPQPFKTYRSLEPISLPRQIEPSSVPALDALAGREPDAESVQRLDFSTLAALLHFTAGITKIKRSAGGEIALRAAACTGALYHVEVYLACGSLAGLPAGLYHFAPYDPALRRLRAGDWRGALVEATGGEPAVAAAPVVLALTSTFWRNSWKYQARAYRHAFWDSGAMLANALACASTYGLSARILLGFADQALNRLLDIDSDREAAVALFALGRDGSSIPSPHGEPAELRYETEPLSPSEVDYPLIREMHVASSLETGAQVRAWRDGAAPRPRAPSAGPLIRLASLDGSERPADPIEAVIARRGSTRQFARLPISLAQLATMLDCATGVIPADFLRAGGGLLNDIYLIVHAVDGLASGSYVYHPELRALELLREGDFRAQAGELDLGQELAADASVNMYMLCDLPAVLDRFGNRGYRAAQMEGGILGGRIYLGAYAQRLGATGLTFFDDDVTAFFGPHADGKAVMFLTAVGRSVRRGDKGSAA